MNRENKSRKTSRSSNLEYAVVGGGVSGTYVAWRLLDASHNPTKIKLFEAEQQVGGRLLTVDMPRSTCRVELGGMRYSKKQLLLSNLIPKLGFTGIPFKYPICFYYLRGCHFGSRAL